MKNFIILSVFIAILSGCSAGSIRKNDYSAQENHGIYCTTGDCINGYGTRAYPNGSQYTGYFSESSRNGNGTHVFRNGEALSGSWEKGRLNGKCHYREAGGSWELGLCTWKNTDGTLSFARDLQEVKKEASKERAKKTLERIRRM